MQRSPVGTPRRAFLFSDALRSSYTLRVTSEPSANRRISPRIEVFAQAEVRSRDVQIMEVRNVSSGGVYLVGTPEQYPDLIPGKDFGLVIFGSEEGLGDDPDFNIACNARIIRIDAGNPGRRPAGFGVTIDPVDEDARERLTKLLLRAEHFRVGDPRR